MTLPPEKEDAAANPSSSKGMLRYFNCRKVSSFKMDNAGANLGKLH